MLEGADAAARDHWHADRFRHGAREREVESALRAVAIHAREEQLAGAAAGHLPGPFYGIESARLAASVRVHLPTALAVGARIARGGDVEARALGGTCLVVAAGDLDRVAGIAKAHELPALHDAAGVHIEAGDDAFREHEKPGRGAKRGEPPPYASPAATFSAW